jgi:hypothetical protein
MADIFARALASSIGKIPNTKTWTAIDGQTVFTLSNSSYVPNKNLIEVIVESIPQISGDHYTETSSTSFTLNEPLSAGMKVYAKWYESKVPETIGHSTRHESGGNDEIDITKLKNYDVITSSLAENASYQLSLKDFSVYEDGITDNVTVFSNAITSAKTSGKVIKLKPITYVLSSLTIDGIRLDLNGATLKVSGNITIKNDGKIENGIIDGGGINSISGKNTIKHVTIKNFTTYAISVGSGAYENIIDFIRLENNTPSTSTIGVQVNASDNYISNIYGYGAFEAIQLVSGSDNFFSNVHLWINSSSKNTFANSIFIHIIGATGNYFTNCASDTYNNIFKFDNTFLFASVTNLFVIHNPILYPNVTINFTNINNMSLKGDCTVKGTSWTSNNIVFACSFYSSVAFSFIDYSLLPVNLTKSNLDAKITGKGSVSANSQLKVVGNKIFGNLTIFFSPQFDLSLGNFTIDVSDLLNVKGFVLDGYAMCVGNANVLTYAMWTLTNGIITITKISGLNQNVWSASFAISGTFNNNIN